MQKPWVLHWAICLASVVSQQSGGFCRSTWEREIVHQPLDLMHPFLMCLHAGSTLRNRMDMSTGSTGQSGSGL